MQITDEQAKAMTSAGLNLIAQALTIYDSNLQLVVSNAPFQQMFSLPDRLVTPGATFRETIRHLAARGEYGPVEDVDSFVNERIDQALAFKPHYMERTRANGCTISVEGSPLPQGGWVTVYTDITATKQQEALLSARSDALSDQVLAHAEQLSATNRKLAAMITTLEETKRQLTASEARTRLTTQMMPAHIAHVDANGHYTFSNNKLSTVMPGRPTDIAGLHISAALGAQAYERIEPALKDAFNGIAAIKEFTHDASARRIRAAFTPDTLGGAYILSMDITEETQTRVALQQTRKRELAAQMISGLAHDFSNLLTIILGMQSRLGRLPDLPEQALELVNGTLAAARRGGTLLSSIADVTGPRAQRPTATAPATVLSDLATLANPALPDGMTLVIENNAPDQAVLLDKGHITDSLLNLILNARDACGAAGNITLKQRVVNDTWIEWTVEDSGPGFSPIALERGIDPFFTTKASEGSGLGLSMVYDMAKSAGGDLRLRNGDTGALITLRLPYRAALPATTGLVLLVEDDGDIRASVRDMLMHLGHSVIEAISADEATALLADLPDIAMILSDIQLVGEATGLDLAQRNADRVPMLLMTSLPPDNALFRSGQRLAPVLRKPFTADDLAALITPTREAPE
ncbi:hybrid sensor histidine kinase/response regulator [Sulfitobacter sp. M57]|uniref:PAS-domain containing protein n=1 Tax=unclassified Sulfitobacter TaxID=196795 RepID=UPI0023E0C24F|nr:MULTISPECIES: PAS-domain containing protein [unclassified Sulfitobacter]MDF3415413.1 hybrid sensor histidine kinase/response regulator [Sulfitobacter sp. KE5]MDF3422894.1 hybrid sensor histidine kinase/response regulator [Sulfitobacter sp. KE43]MDF3433959.1 hybrid sensor histidine kinase/response regulator [Sulfitobacter sp. KE42]MDF3459599.1 hybrid sensor histidine kinase/response regulator [Sulfitobacter sp. S74]MDF3463498.1 hybrid sensor histidine kinase/response regulator [Sulfitobacter